MVRYVPVPPSNLVYQRQPSQRTCNKCGLVHEAGLLQRAPCITFIVLRQTQSAGTYIQVPCFYSAATPVLSLCSIDNPETLAMLAAAKHQSYGE